jgi:hypothetical protein
LLLAGDVVSTNPARDMLAAFVGRQIPGGCDHCDAYQTVRTARDQFGTADDPDDYLDGCFICTVHHDDDCPWWRRYQNRAARRAAAKRRRTAG